MELFNYGVELALNTGLSTRSFSFENPTGARGAGGAAASGLGVGRKGAASRPVAPREAVILAEHEGPGCVRHLWMTTDLTPDVLRGCFLRMTWDDLGFPSVEVPIGDFFGIAHGRHIHFVNALQAMQEGVGLNAYFPMPFQRSMRIEFVNDRDEELRWLFYQVDATLGDKVPERMGRFHGVFVRENPTELARDFTILPLREGRGRFLGCVIGVRTLSPGWWGEGEFKAYLDGDGEFPTLVGTGTEDYIGSAWGLGQHFALYSGAPLIVATEPGIEAGIPGWQRLISFYRWHLPDPIYFAESIRITMQQLGTGWLPIGEYGLYERRDDWSCASFWYQQPCLPLPPMPDIAARTADLMSFPGEAEPERLNRH